MEFISIKNHRSSSPVKLSYCDYGEGKPVVLIHGWPLSKEMWEYQLEPLVNAGLRVVKYDRRGFGQSDKPWDGYDYDTLAGDLKELLDQLGLNEVTLVGFSMGGGEVARYFTKYGGERVSKVVLISTVLPSMSKSDKNQNGVPKEIFDELLKQINNDRIGFLDDFGKHFFGVNLLSHPLSAPLLDYYRMLGSMASPRATKECMKSFTFTDFTDDIANINVPTLIIHGTADATVPVEISSEWTSRLMPNSTYIKYEGAAHGLFYTHREDLNRDLISFIKTGVVKDNREDSILFPANETVAFPIA